MRRRLGIAILLGVAGLLALSGSLALERAGPAQAQLAAHLPPSGARAARTPPSVPTRSPARPTASAAPPGESDGDTGANDDGAGPTPPPGHELEYFACLVEGKRFESLLRLYALLDERPDLEEEILHRIDDLADVVPIDGESMCQGEDAVANRLLGQQLCDVTDSRDVPEDIGRFCGR